MSTYHQDPETLADPFQSIETIHRWTKMPDCDEFVGSRRSKHTVVAYKESLYVFGGDNGKNMLNDFLRFDTREKSWVRAFSLGTPPAPRYHHSAVVYGDSMYIFGGYTGNLHSNINLTNKNDLFRYKFSTGQWTEWKFSGLTPVPRSAHGSVVYNGKLWIFAGYDGNSRLNDMWSISLAGDTPNHTWEEIDQLGERPHPVCNFPINVVKDSAFLFSGQSGAKMTNSLFQFNFKEKLWTRISTEHILGSKFGPTRRYGHTMVAFDNTLFVFGGADNTLPSELYSYDIDLKLWSVVQTSPDSHPISGRVFHAAAVENDAMYIYGGTCDANVRSGEMYRFQLSSYPKCTLHEDFGNLLDSKQLCDMEFIVSTMEGDVRIQAHQCIIGARSQWLRSRIRKAREKILGTTTSSTSSSSLPLSHLKDAPFLEIRLMDTTPEALELLLKYIYTDRIDLTKQSKDSSCQKVVLLMMDVYRLAVQCHMRWLEYLCIQYLENTINSLNVLEALKTAAISQLHFLKEFCLKFIVKEANYTQIVMSDEFESLDQKLMVELVRRRQSPRLNVTPSPDQTSLDIHMTTLEQDMEQFLLKKEFCDVTLTLDNTAVSAHKPILAARSSYFEGMFRSFPPEDNTVKIQIGDSANSRQSFDALTILLRYIYFGEVRMAPEQSLYLLLYAPPNFFGFMNNRLQAFCQNNLRMNVTFENLIQILEAASRIQAMDMKKYALNLITHNLSKCVPRMKTLSRDLLLEILEAIADPQD